MLERAAELRARRDARTALKGIREHAQRTREGRRGKHGNRRPGPLRLTGTRDEKQREQKGHRAHGML